jgi:ParB-like chromosome segregation protein Spo0J
MGMDVQPRRHTSGNPLPPLDAKTDADLRESIAKYGVLTPILVDQRGDILDGHHRHRIADELGIACPEEPINVPEDPDERAELLAQLNDARRQRLTPEERRHLVMRLRDAGLSERDIERQTGIPKTTVHRDLTRQVVHVDHLGESRDSNGDSGQVVIPDRVTGRDGKRYPAQQPQKPAKSKPAKDKPPQQWGWRRLLRKCAKSLPYQLRTRPPDVSEALEIRGALVAVLAELDRYLRERGVSAAPSAEPGESNGGMTLEEWEAKGSGAPAQQSLDVRPAAATNGHGHDHAALTHLRCARRELSEAQDMPRPLIEDCQDALDGIDGQLQRLRDLDEAER